MAKYTISATFIANISSLIINKPRDLCKGVIKPVANLDVMCLV